MPHGHGNYIPTVCHASTIPYVSTIVPHFHYVPHATAWHASTIYHVASLCHVSTICCVSIITCLLLHHVSTVYNVSTVYHISTVYITCIHCILWVNFTYYLISYTIFILINHKHYFCSHFVWLLNCTQHGPCHETDFTLLPTKSFLWVPILLYICFPSADVAALFLWVRKLSKLGSHLVLLLLWSLCSGNSVYVKTLITSHQGVTQKCLSADKVSWDTPLPSLSFVLSCYWLTSGYIKIKEMQLTYGLLLQTCLSFWAFSFFMTSLFI